MEFLRTIDPVWISLAPLFLIKAVLISSMVYFFSTYERRPYPSYLEGRNNSKLLSAKLKHWWYWNNMPVARFLVRCKMTPNTLTLIGFFFSLAAAFLYADGLFGYAGWVMIFGATFDLFDGYVARLTNKMSKSGAFFDSVVDRFSEGVVFIGLAFYFRDTWLLAFVVAGLIGSMLVSYARARGEAVGVDCKVGSMQRPERIVYLGVASIFQPLLTWALPDKWSGAPPVLIIGVVILVAVMTNATAFYRMVYIMNELDTKEHRSAETSVPRLITDKFLKAKGK